MAITMKTMKTSKQRVILDKPPDGGWGWVAVVAVFIVLFIGRGIPNSVGVFFAVLTDYYQEGAGSISWITSSLSAVSLCTGPFSAALSKRYAHRNVVFVGGLIAGVSLVITTFATGVTYIFITFGILTGIGFGLARAPAVSMLGRYFEKRHASANGMAFVGTGCGSFVFAPFTRALINTYGWRGSFIIIGAICLNICVAATLLRPLYLKGDVTEENDKKDLQRSDKNATSDRRSTSEELLNHKPASRCSKIARTMNEHFELSLFKNVHFTLIMISSLFCGFGVNIPLIHTVKRALDIGMTENEASLLVSILGFCMMIGGFGQGLLVDLLHMSKGKVFGSAITLYGVFTIIIVFVESFFINAIIMGLLGIFRGTLASLYGPIVREITGRNRFTGGYGLSLLFLGIAQMVGPVMAGYLYDMTSNYDVSFYVGGISTTISGLMVLGHTFFTRCRSSTEKGEQSGYDEDDIADSSELPDKLKSVNWGSNADAVCIEDMDQFAECQSVMSLEKETSI